MIAMAHFAGLVITTIFAAAAAVLLDWLFLQAMFHLIRPAAKTTSAKTTHDNGYATAFETELVNGTRELARRFGAAALRR